MQVWPSIWLIFTSLRIPYGSQPFGFKVGCLSESANESSVVGEHFVMFQRSLSLCKGYESLSLGLPRRAARSAFGVFPSRARSHSLQDLSQPPLVCHGRAMEWPPQPVIGPGLLASHQITCRALSQESSRFQLFTRRKFGEGFLKVKQVGLRDKKHALSIAEQPQQGRSCPGPRGQCGALKALGFLGNGLYSCWDLMFSNPQLERLPRCFLFFFGLAENL